MLLYDCFTFCDGLDLLDIRLAELSPFVDTFVIAEAPVTFQGKPKPLYYQENKARFRVRTQLTLNLFNDIRLFCFH
jgi:beta-1,4-mannosyl-glycoprotein beta-1,4-N-acetylglucosaminyltransferase